MRKKIGACTVDSGMLMVGDPCYFIGEQATIRMKCKGWTQACKEVFSACWTAPDTPCDVYGLGVAIGTTHGDGCYPVYLETTNGRRRIVVELD